MSRNELFRCLDAEQLRHLLLGPYDYERKLQGEPPAAPVPPPPRRIDGPRRVLPP